MNIGLLGLLDLQLAIIRMNRYAASVPADKPHSAPRAREWDSMTLATAMDKLLFTRTCKQLLVVAIRALCGVEPQDMSFLHFLAYLNSSGGFERLTTIRNGNQVAVML